MVAQVKWSDEAILDLDIAVIQCRGKFGAGVATKFYRQVKANEKYLASYPRIGKVEPQLASDDDPLTYRSLVVHKHYKLVYLVEGEVIRIVKFWDTRRNPLDLIGSLR